LWTERLGPQLALQLWRGQRRLWWQFWGGHADAGAYLALVAPARTPLPPQALRVDDLLVVAPSPLARQLLQEQLKLRRREPRGLEQRCSRSLLQREAVHWKGAALGQMLGPLAALGQSVQQGCLLLSSEGSALLWQGEAEATDATLLPAPSTLPVPAAVAPPGGALLELSGRRFDLVLRGLLSSALLRDALAERYGLGAEQMRRLQAAPFLLRLSPQPTGPYRAGVMLLLDLPGDRAGWDRVLADLSRALERQGLERSRPLPAFTLWSREDSSSVGGWRWLGSRQLLLFLGPVPGQMPALTPPASATYDWQLQLRPQALLSNQLLPERLPLVVQRSRWLLLQGSGQKQSALAGRLELR
jgi:hypothetical protein